MIRVTAYGKVNLFLEITGKRPDGYHTLSTVFQTISIGDKLTLQPASDLTLTCTDPSLPTDDRNLALKAASALRAHLKETRGAQIHLEKIVPMGAGLGGGSSDAAAVLLALLQLWQRPLSSEALASLAVHLGADVPFFLTGGTCLASGIGEMLTPLPPLPKTWLVLVYPGFGVSTKEAYTRVRLPFSGGGKVPRSCAVASVIPADYSFVIPADRKPGSILMEPPLTDAGDDDHRTIPWPHSWTLSTTLFNRFEELVFPDHPELPQLKQQLLDAGAGAALMSGSGSCVFGVASSRVEGERIHEEIRSSYPHSWLVHTL